MLLVPVVLCQAVVTNRYVVRAGRVLVEWLLTEIPPLLEPVVLL